MPDLRERVDAILHRFLEERRDAIGRVEPSGALLIEEIGRLLDAGGKRIRPAFCVWGARAAGPPEDVRLLRAASALELLHTMAIVHDDLIDGAKERRGVPATAVRFAERAEELGATGDPEEFGRAAALLVGDLSLVLADELFLASGYGTDRLEPALARYHAMRERMAAGEFLDVLGGAADGPHAVHDAAALKGGAYTVEGPLLIGSALGGGSREADSSLSAYGRSLGVAFQLRDDLEDGDAPPSVDRSTVEGLVAEAIAAIDRSAIAPEATVALRELAEGIAP